METSLQALRLSPLPDCKTQEQEPGFSTSLSRLEATRLTFFFKTVSVNNIFLKNSRQSYAVFPVQLIWRITCQLLSSSVPRTTANPPPKVWAPQGSRGMARTGYTLGSGKNHPLLRVPLRPHLAENISEAGHCSWKQGFFLVPQLSNVNHHLPSNLFDPLIKAKWEAAENEQQPGKPAPLGLWPS